MDKDLMLSLYRDMVRIRRFEEEAARAYTRGKIGGFLHLYIGQEAVAVGAISAVEPTDYIVATYREHGHYLARVGDMNAAMAELFGKVTGCAKGKGGSMHFFDVQKRFLGGHAIVGGHVPIAAGIAFASKYRSEPDVTLCFFGEGTANIGAFHEGMALASLWKLPVVFICENNLYSMGTPLYRTLAVEDVAVRAKGYPMQQEIVNGDDVLEVREAVRRAAKRARNESLPTLIEAKTYRFRGHSMSDPAKYRTKEEVEEWMKRDPIRILANRIYALGIANEAQLQAIDEEAKREVAEAVKFADASPPPDPAALYEDVYCEAVPEEDKIVPLSRRVQAGG
ncbi:MAG: pyruvate dehydrogenase (acetyl-transferring) E1 component subunit alpha [Candidatus Binatia bacterium]|nr:pyruvate dehydrogenase (acetyl-transferring) E1 component subunit alpha [Candidatus Binatia bacterium]